MLPSTKCFLSDDFDFGGPSARKKIRFKPKLKLKEDKTESDPNVLGFTDESDDDDDTSDDDDDDDNDDDDDEEAEEDRGCDDLKEVSVEPVTEKETEKVEAEKKVPEIKLPVVVDPTLSTPARFVPVHR